MTSGKLKPGAKIDLSTFSNLDSHTFLEEIIQQV
jgi:hypothetical protein